MQFRRAIKHSRLQQ